MMISIVSVPHTGTQFTEQLLVGMGYDVRCAHVHSTHPAQNPKEWIERGDKVVIPWRDPELAQISSLNRGQDPRPLSEFADLLLWSERENVHLFTVEPDDKDMELAHLEAFLEPVRPPVTDWAPVNTSEDVTGRKEAYGLARGP